MNSIVLIADIVASRQIKERDKIQRDLKNLLIKINKISGSMLSPMTITLGDEFQCVYSSADEIFNHIWKILVAVYPEKIRFSYGIGLISTRINKNQAIGMDGPAFYEARTGLNQLKERNYLFNISVSGNQSENIYLIRNSLYLVSYHINNWKKNRIKIMGSLSDGMQIKTIAKNLNISEQAVYKNITSGGLDLINDLSKNISGSFNDMIKN
ncbi:MAG TPA: SatD family protein [Ignavibacteriaceae bacterium]|nr:SatD family protein [Ignavibacteriaceae bacterium]